jgi:serine acetyltransferase
VGANAVVLTNIPAGATAVGIPAQVVRRAPRLEERQPELCCAAAADTTLVV